MNPYKTSEDRWFLLVVTPDKLAALANSIGRPDLLTDPRFSDPRKQSENGAQLRQILDDIFAKQPLSYWREVFDKAHITFGAILEPAEVINDPQLVENEMVVGLGSGTTAAFAVETVAARIAKGLRVVAIPSSNRYRQPVSE